MFVKNQSRSSPVLARADISDSLSVGAIVVRAAYAVSAEGLVPWEAPRTALDTDAPTTAKQAVWEGTSVTVSGVVHGPKRPPHLCRVDLHVGDEKRSILVLGPRQWVRNAGKLVASSPAAFDAQSLSWSLSFGGSFELPPGPDPIRGLPHPGGLVPYPLNPGGMGFYRDEPSAEGRPLPCVEHLEHKIQRWDERPRPAGLSPCPELDGLRAPALGPSDEDNGEWHLRAALRANHHAPGELVFDDVAPEVPIRLEGVGTGAVLFQVPRSPVRVTTLRGRTSETVGFRVRSIHLAADGAVIVETAHAFAFARSTAPTWVQVADA